jgi:crossover junction endodeoxyribonuclease RusA
VIRLALPYPAKILWPNGRGHHQRKGSATRKHREWATYAVMEQGSDFRAFDHDGASQIRVHITVHGKPKGPLPDKDNCSAAAKAFLDGIAQRLAVNDRFFAAPTVEFADPRDSRFIIEIGEPHE